MLETICDILVESYKRNWITSRDGNISIRHHDRDHFYVTPSGVRKQTMQPDQFKKIKILSDRHWEEMIYSEISSGLQPTGEMPLHFGLQHKIHTDEVRVVTHIHPTYCVAAMHAGIELSELVKHFPELGRYTRVAPNVGDVPPISQELGDQCHKKLGLNEATGEIKYDIVGIKGHGVVAIDSTPWRSFEHIERLEHICKIVLASGNY
jgi:L-fuculose-phosphate aldolase